MATMMLMEWPGVTEDEYNHVVAALGLDANPPVGAAFHVAGFSGGSLHVLDVWESQRAFERFQQERLAGAVQKAGIVSQPKVQFFPVHNMYAPNLERIRTTASSLPKAVGNQLPDS